MSYNVPGTSFRKKKKNMHPKFCLVITRKVSAQNNVISNFAEGENFLQFLDLRTTENHGKPRRRNFLSWQLLLYSSRSIYSGISKNFCPTVREKPRKGGSPLRRVMGSVDVSDHFVYCSSLWNELELYSFVSDKGRRTGRTRLYRTTYEERNYRWLSLCVMISSNRSHLFGSLSSLLSFSNEVWIPYSVRSIHSLIEPCRL